MGWHKDHMDAVINRWADRFQRSNMTASQFSTSMYNTMIKYGWTESEAEQMANTAVKTGDKK